MWHEEDELYLEALHEQLRQDQVRRELRCKWRLPLFGHIFVNVVDQEGLVRGQNCKKCGRARHV